jgi:SNF2 family DNA or RNA helicase
MLDVVEPALAMAGFRFQRIDGTKTLEQRRGALRNFDKEPSCTVLLATLGSTAVGFVATYEQ